MKLQTAEMIALRPEWYNRPAEFNAVLGAASEYVNSVRNGNASTIELPKQELGELAGALELMLDGVEISPLTLLGIYAGRNKLLHRRVKEAIPQLRNLGSGRNVNGSYQNIALVLNDMRASVEHELGCERQEGRGPNVYSPL